MATRRRWALPLLASLLMLLVVGVLFAMPDGAGAASQVMEPPAGTYAAAGAPACAPADTYPEIALDSIKGNVVDLASDGETMWVLQETSTDIDTLSAYNLSTGARDTSKDINPQGVSNLEPLGVWIDETTLYMPDIGSGDVPYPVRAFKRSDGTVDTGKGFTLTWSSSMGGAGNFPGPLWSDGETMWVVDQTGPSVAAYSLVEDPDTPATEYGAYLSARNLTTPVEHDFIAGHGTTLWSAHQDGGLVAAYDLTDYSRDQSKEFQLPAGVTVGGLWADGERLWVAQNDGTKISVVHQRINASGLAVAGTPLPGERLSANRSGLTDPNGIADDVRYSYQWLRDCQAIPGATGDSYRMTEADLSSALTLRVSFTDEAGNAEEVFADPSTRADQVINVPWHWDLVPEDLRRSGGDFRLIFLTETGFAPDSTDIEDYNRFVQEQARATDSLEALRTYHRWFRVLGSTADVDAHVNTATSIASSNSDVPVYWLKGNRVADNYNGFYAGDWNNETSPTNRLGTTLSVNAQFGRDVITGSNSDGTEKVGNALGDEMVSMGRLDGVDLPSKPMGSTNPVANTDTSKSYYALSPVFRMSEGKPEPEPDPEPDPEASEDPNAATRVPANWSLAPSGLAVGDRFRLIFVTSTGRDAKSTNVSDYNTFVRVRAALGHADIQEHAGHFWAVASARFGGNARDNTGTNFSSNDKGVPIYWMNGNKVADDYADFYDGDWDEEAQGRNESGEVRTFSGSDLVWTGSDHQGTGSIFIDDDTTVFDSQLGNSTPRYGQPNSSAVEEGPLSSGEGFSRNSQYPLYGLSGVFEMGPSRPPRSEHPLVSYHSVLNSGNLPAGSQFRVMFAGIYFGHDATYTDSNGRELRICDTDPDEPECAIDEENTNIHDYNRLVQQMARWNGKTASIQYPGIPISGKRRAPFFRALISTAGTDARDNTDTTYTYSDDDDDTNDDLGVPIYWLTGKKVADDYRDFYDGTWDNPNDAINFRGAPVNRRAWPHATGSRSDGTVDLKGFLGHPSGKIRTGSGDNPLGGGELTDVDSPFYIYALSPIFEVRPPKPQVEFLSIGVDQTEATIAISAYAHEDVPLTGFRLYAQNIPDRKLNLMTLVDVDPSLVTSTALITIQGTSTQCQRVDTSRSGYTYRYGCTHAWTGLETKRWYMVQVVGEWEDGSTETGWVYFRAGYNRLFGLDRPGQTQSGQLVSAPAQFEFPTTAPGAVRGLTADVGEAGITLSWREPEDNGGSDMVFYRVERQTEGSSYEELDSGTLDTGYLDPSPPASGFVSYRVTPYNAAGEGPFSGVVLKLAPAPANTQATGAPTISGTAQVGETLTADTSGIADADGLTQAVFAYQWLADDAEIQGANGSGYTLTGAEQGKTVTVTVTFTDDAGNQESRTSEPTGPVAPDPGPLTGFTVVDTSGGSDTVLGTLEDGGTLTLEDPASQFHGIRVDTNSNDDIHKVELALSGAKTEGKTEGVFPYSLYGDEGEGNLNGEDLPVGNYQLTATAYDDDGDVLGTLTVSFTVAEYQPPVEEQQTAQPNSGATGAPTINGTARVGETLTVDTAGIVDADGLDTATFRYQWRADGVAIQDATGSGYTLSEDDADKAITVTVSFTDDAGHQESRTSAATAAVAAAANNRATGAPTINGTAQVGETLTADTSGIVDADGLDTATFSYQWRADGVAIQDATGSGYTLSEDDADKAITVTVSFTDDAGHQESRTSAATAAVAAAANNRATGAPTITGTAQVGETLTADTSGIVDADGLDTATFSYQWRADDVAIAGANGSSYTLLSDDEDKAITVTVTFTDDAGNPETLTSAPTGEVAAKPNNHATGAPTITGTVRVGETLTASTSGIVDADGLDTATFSYQWLADDVAIAGATGSSYTLTQAEQGKTVTVTVTVTFTDDAGHQESLPSAATAAVAVAVPDEPENLAAEASAQGIKLTWSAPDGSVVTGYVVYRGILQNGSMNGRAMSEYDDIEATGADMAYTDAHVEAGVEYRYRVAAVNSSGEGGKSGWVNIRAKN